MCFKAFTIVFTLFLLQACGSDNRSPASVGEIIMSGSLAPERNLNVEQTNIALRLCYMFRSKRNYLKSFGLGKKFVFKIQENSCLGVTTESRVEVDLEQKENEPSMIFASKDKHIFLNDVLTDEDGPMSHICKDLFEGKTVSNTHQTKSGRQIQIELSHESNKDIIKVFHGVGGIDNYGGVSYSTSYIDTYEIDISPGKSEYSGMARKAMRSFSCGNDKGTNDLVQFLVTD